MDDKEPPRCSPKRWVSPLRYTVGGSISRGGYWSEWTRTNWTLLLARSAIASAYGIASSASGEPSTGTMMERNALRDMEHLRSVKDREPVIRFSACGAPSPEPHTGDR